MAGAGSSGGQSWASCPPEQQSGHEEEVLGALEAWERGRAGGLPHLGLRRGRVFQAERTTQAKAWRQKIEGVLR